MAFQLVYTSAAKLLDAGRSGYGTVARSKSITPLVVSAIERVSQFANQRGLDRHRVIHVHRRITAGSNRFHVLTRIVDAGADYTGRTNHLAHHLVISQEEAARAAARDITPADVLQQFPWLGRWDDSARFFDSSEDVVLENFKPDGKDSKRQSWTSVTRNPAHARLLSFDGAPRTGVLIVPEGVDSLALLAEALSEFGPQSWSRSFTTSLETTDELSDLEWIVTTPAAFTEIQPRCGSRTLLDLTNPAILPIPPAPAPPPPQLASASGSPSGLGVYTPPAPDLTNRQSSSNPVQVRVAETGTRAAASARRSSNSKEDKKTRIKLMGGLAALLLCVGLLVFVAIRDTKVGDITDDPNARSKTSEQKLTDNQQQAVRNLQEIGILKLDAELLAVKAGDNALKWADYVIESNNQIMRFFDITSSLELTGLVSPPDTRTPPGSPAGSPGWLESLVSGTVKLRNLGTGTERFKSLNEAIGSLRNTLAGGGLPKLKDTNPDFDVLFCKIAKPWLFEILKSQRLDDFEDVLNIPDIWDKMKFQKRHGLLEMAIQDAFDKVKNPSLNSDKLIEILRKYPQFSAQLEQIIQADTGKPRIPEEAQPNSNQVAREVMWNGVPDKQIILVSKGELKNGVHVPLLKAVMEKNLAWNKPSEIKLTDFTVKVTPSDSNEPEKIKLFLMAGTNFYCWTLDETRRTRAPTFSTDGLFAMEKEGVQTVKFSYPSPAKEAWIAVDERSKECIFTDLKFQIILSGKTGHLSGTLADRLKIVKTSDKNLQVILNTPKELGSSVSISEATIESMPGLPIPSPSEKIFPFTKLEGIDLQTSYAAANKTFLAYREIPLSKVNERKTKLIDLKSDCGKLISQLNEVIGTTYASKIIDRNGSNFNVHGISKEDRANIIADLQKINPTLDIRTLRENSNEWEKYKDDTDKKQMKKNIKTQSSAFFGLLGKSILEHSKEFDIGDFDSKSIWDENGVVEKEEAAITFFAEFLKRAEVVSVPIEKKRQDYLDSITNLTVQTENGRILFKATKE